MCTGNIMHQVSVMLWWYKQWDVAWALTSPQHGPSEYRYMATQSGYRRQYRCGFVWWGTQREKGKTKWYKIKISFLFGHIGHYCSDMALAIYILLILTPNIIIISVWTSVDKYHFTIEYKSMKTSTEILTDCDSNYESIWIGCLCIYLLILALALTIVAVKTRKVRMEHFKDTKKVNILLFVLCVGIILTFSYWLLLQTLNAKPYIVSIPLNIGHSTLVCSFQSLLFAPKGFPPLWQYINRKFNNIPQSTETTSTRKETTSTTTWFWTDCRLMHTHEYDIPLHDVARNSDLMAKHH